MNETVLMNSLKPGQRFRFSQGEVWTYRRKDGALSGVHWCENGAGEMDCFAGCAKVELVGDPI